LYWGDYSPRGGGISAGRHVGDVTHIEPDAQSRLSFSSGCGGVSVGTTGGGSNSPNAYSTEDVWCTPGSCCAEEEFYSPVGCSAGGVCAECARVVSGGNGPADEVVSGG